MTSDLKYRAETLKRRVSITEVFEAMGERFQGNQYSKWRRGTVMSSLVVNTQDNTWARYKLSSSDPYSHGDVFDLIMLQTGVSFPEAVEMVERGDYGVLRSLPAETVSPSVKPPAKIVPDQHLVYHRALDEFARGWWHDQGIGDDAISRFWLGVCEYHD